MGNTIMQLLLGGFLGVLGQAIRTVMGIKKMKEKQSANMTNIRNGNAANIPDSEFSGRRLGLGLLGGFIAGALCGLFVVDLSVEDDGYKKAMAAIIAAGYSGVDFIEGIMKKYLPV